MYGKWMCFVILDLVIVTCSTRDRFYHDYHTSHDKNPWSGDWSQGWQHDWLGQTTTRPTRRKTTTARVVTESTPTPTHPQPVIRDVEIRLGESQTTDSPTPTPRPITLIQDESLVKEQKPQTVINSGQNRDNFQSVGAENSDIKPVQAEMALSNNDNKPVFNPASDNNNGFGITVVDDSKANNNGFGIAVVDDSEAKPIQETALPNNDAKPQDSIGTDQITPISTIDAVDNQAKPVQADPNDSKKPVSDDDNYEEYLASIDAALGDIRGTNNGKDAPLFDEKASMWHVAIYEKKMALTEHVYTCGGSLIKADMVISAGHCFWSPVWQALPTTRFRVAAGKLYPDYGDQRDTNAQYSEIKNISISDMDEPCKQPDLAFMILVRPFIYTSIVKPVCFSLDWDLESIRQIREENIGTVASWIAIKNGECVPRRHSWLSLPFAKSDVCQYKVHYQTTGSTLSCPGEMNITTACDTDSGNGLVFYRDKVPFILGVATAPVVRRCGRLYSRRTYTVSAIIEESGDLRKFLKGITADVYNLGECENLYRNPNDNNQNNETDYGLGDRFVQVAPPAEDGNLYTGQGIGSTPVPTLPGTSAPSFQWHVGVYSKRWAPYMQICGGSLVKRDFVISAAHCFWEDVGGQQRASLFAVAGGKLFRPWNNTQDTYAQHSDVSEIILPARFRGGTTSFQDDIAILRLTTPFTYAPGVQSVCVDFDRQFEMKQLRPGNIGTILGWGLTEKNGNPSQRLTYLDLPYIDVDKCFADSEFSFHKYITSDKICAGDVFTGKALCRGDSGGGFVLYSSEIPYLHGVSSTAAGDDNLCNAFAIAAFTSLYAHRAFLRDNIPDIDKECVQSETRTQSAQKVNVDTALGIEGAVTTGAPTSVYTNMPYFPYPNHFVCNCNCNP
ncbi:transmembrane protease serine 9-like [Cydia splendana]|uniref:transmembrane protease serine 9-like n=1 Tax=Cydia splendana TaxID=1100963 RepID=UPI0028F4C0F9